MSGKEIRNFCAYFMWDYEASEYPTSDPFNIFSDDVCWFTGGTDPQTKVLEYCS